MVAVLTIPNHPFRHDVWLNNSVSENVVLHIRNLCDFCTSPHADDIKPSDLFDNYAKDPKYKGLQRLIRRVHKKYGTNRQGCVRWALNKKLAHSTKTRGTKFTYTRYAMRVLPVLEDVFTEMERLKGRSFESLLFAPKLPRKTPPEAARRAGATLLAQIAQAVKIPGWQGNAFRRAMKCCAAAIPNQALDQIWLGYASNGPLSALARCALVCSIAVMEGI